MNKSQVSQLNVNLTSNQEGQECVSLHITGGLEVHSLCLTPSQARALATDLITAVNRAEVKANLKFSPNMWRRNGEQPTGMVVSG